MLGTRCLAAVHTCQTAKVRGASRVSPKSLTVNTITARIGGCARGLGTVKTPARPHFGPLGAWRSSLLCEPATTSPYWQPPGHSCPARLPGACHERLSGPWPARPSQRMAKSAYPPRGASQISVTPSTLPGVSPSRSQSRRPWQLSRGLRHDLDPAVVQIESKATQAADLEGLGPREPAETHTLDASAHPGGDAYVFVHRGTLTGQLHSEHFAPLRLGVPSRTTAPHSNG